MVRTHAARKNIQWAMIALVVGGTILISGVSGFLGFFKTVNSSLGSVNGLPISLSEFRTAFHKEQRLITAYREQFGPNYKRVLSYLGKSDNIEQEAQEYVIVNKLLLEMAQSLPVHLHTAYIKRELAQPRTIFTLLGETIPAHYIFTEQGALKVEVLSNFLRHEGLTMQQFEDIAEEFLTGQFGGKLAYHALAVSRSARKLQELTKFSKKTFELKVVGLEPLMKEERKQVPSQEEIEAFYNKHATSHRYWSPERRSGSFWTFELSAFSTSPEASPSAKASEDKPLEQASPKDTFMGAAQQLVLMSDEKTFKQFVDNYNGRSSSLSKIAKVTGSKDPLFEALFSVGVVGEKGVAASDSKGYLVELTEVIAPHKLTLEAVRSRVIEDIYRERAEKKALELLATAPLATTFVVEPGASALPEKLGRYSLSAAVMQGLIVPGDTKDGVEGQNAYRLTLVSSDSPEPSDQEKKSQQGKLAEEEGELMLRELIASLRSTAIIVVSSSMPH